MSTEPNQPSAAELAEFLRDKIASAEKTLRMRLEMASTCRSGTQAEWAAAARTNGCKPSTKSERLKEAEGHDRIAVKCRREVAMFKAVAFANTELRGFMEEFPMKVATLTAPLPAPAGEKPNR